MRERFQTFILEDSTPTKNETPQGRGQGTEIGETERREEAEQRGKGRRSKSRHD